jgi:hypothetical protein
MTLFLGEICLSVYSKFSPWIVEIYNSLDINPDKVNLIDTRPILESYDLALTLVSEI